MNDSTASVPFSWLDGPLPSRIARGVPLVIFGAQDQFDGANFRLAAVRDRFNRLRATIPDLRITKIDPLSDIDPVREGARLHSFFEDVKRGRPRILFVADPKTTVEMLSCNPLDGTGELSKIVLADRLIAAVANDAIEVDLSAKMRPYPEDGQPPLTPIEDALLRAIRDRGLVVECQVGFEPYVVDFVVGEGRGRLIVEADGAGFHDPDLDRVRDERIRERYGLDTLRFTGSEIHADAPGCAARIARTLEVGLRNSELYAFEGREVLDASQRKAVEHGKGDVRVLAPAGSGKTKVLVNRIVWLLNQGVRPSQLLVLAFNRKAASQLENRLVTLGVPVGKGRKEEDGVWVATLNSFGNHVLLTEGIKKDLLDKPWKEKKLVEEAVRELGERLVGMRGEDPISTLTKEIARVRRGLRSPVALEVEVPQPSGKRSVAIDALWSAVRNLQERKGVITFDDQIFLATELLTHAPMVRRSWQRRFSHVLVDEYQDLNDAQIALMQILTGGGASIFAVGDDDQVIYSWRDANVVNLLDSFETTYPGVTNHVLEVNYRCAKPIVRASQRLISRNRRRHPKNIRPSETAPEGDITVSMVDGTTGLGTDLVEFVSAAAEKHRHRWEEMAVLTRTNVQLLSAAVALDRAGIPRGPLPSVRLYATPAARRLIAYLSIVADRPNRMSGDDLAEIVNRPNRFVRNEDVERLRNSRRPWLALRRLATGRPGSNTANKELTDLLDALVDLMRSTARGMASVEVVDTILARFPFATLPDESTRSAEDASDDVILHVIREQSRDIPGLRDFIAFMRRSAKEEMGEVDTEEAPVREEPEETDTNVVTMSTIHGAKGREWPVVCMFDTSRPGAKPRDADNELEEERRVFYVGMTRTGARLHLSYVTGRPARFLVEAFLPDQLFGKDASAAKAWIRDRSAQVERLISWAANARTSLGQAKDELSRLESGELIFELERKRSALSETRNTLQDHLAELSGERPVGLFMRIFKGGRSRAEITREIAVIGERLSSLDRQIDTAGADLNAARSNTKDLMERARKKVAGLEDTVSGLREERAQLEAAMADVERVRTHLPMSP